ncbi:MAG: ribonuclease III [Alloprevotella sp.]|nr:ribonuclease III [Alloprevotella sp.]
MIQIIDKIKVFFRKDKKLYTALYAILGFYPQNIELYKMAFTHRSNNQRFQQYRHGRRRDERSAETPEKDNERLEYLGDAVLETVVSEILYHQYPTKREGFLTATRSKLVARETLGKLAKQLELERFMNLPKTGGNRNSYAGGNAFEALVGAIFLDRGYKYAYHFIKHLIKKQIVDVESTAKKEVNFKSRLLEYCQKNKIQYTFDSTSSQADKQASPEFTTHVSIEGLLAGEGKGLSKKESEQNAAKSALVKMRREATFVDDVLRAKEGRTAMEAPEFGALPRIREIDEEVKRLNKLAREEKARQAAEPKPERQPRKSEKHVKARERRAAQQAKAEQEQAKRESAQEKEAGAQTKPRRPESKTDSLPTKPENATSKANATPLKAETHKHHAQAEMGAEEMVIVENIPAIGTTESNQPTSSATYPAESVSRSAKPAAQVVPSTDAPHVVAEKPIVAKPQNPAVAALVEALRASAPVTATATPASDMATPQAPKKAAVADLVSKLAASAKQPVAPAKQLSEATSKAIASEPAKPAIAALLNAMAQTPAESPAKKEGGQKQPQVVAPAEHTAHQTVADSDGIAPKSAAPKGPSQPEQEGKNQPSKGENRRRKKAKPEPTPEEQAAELEAIKAAALREIQASNGRMYE